MVHPSDVIDAFAWKTKRLNHYYRTLKFKYLEKRYGAQFSGRIMQEELGYTKEEGNDYTPSWNFVNTLFRGRATKNYRIMDLGSGKGYAMYLMGKYPFCDIYGVEKSEMLTKQAKENIKRLYPKDHRFHFWAKDATELLDDKDTRNAMIHSDYFYIYNSFPKNVMKKVLRELETIVDEYQCKHTIFYVSPSPECLELVKSSRFYRLKNEMYKDRLGGVYEFESIPQGKSNA